MEKIYASLASRLCSPKCGEKYAAFVIGDATARLGTGKRLLEWLETNQPGAFRQLNGEMPKPLNAFRTGGRPKKYSNQTERKWARKGQGAQRQRSWRRRNAKPSRKSLEKRTSEWRIHFLLYLHVDSQRLANSCVFNTRVFDDLARVEK